MPNKALGFEFDFGTPEVNSASGTAEGVLLGSVACGLDDIAEACELYGDFVTTLDDLSLLSALKTPLHSELCAYPKY